MNYRLLAIKDQAAGVLEASISNSVTTVLLESGNGAKFPSPIKGAATSVGNATTLNATGIMAAGVQVGDHIYNITDGSFATVRVVTDNQVLTTDLEGGADNTWSDEDEWVVNAFAVTFVQYTDKNDPTSSIVKQEKALVIDRSSDTLTVASSGRGYDGSSATNFEAGDSVYLLFKTREIEELQKAIRRLEMENFNRKDEISDRAMDDEVVKLTGAQDIDGVKTFLEIPVLPNVDPTEPNQAVRMAYAEAISGGAFFGILGETASAGHLISCQPIMVEHFPQLSDTESSNLRFGELSSNAKISFRVPVTRNTSISSWFSRVKKVGTPTDDVTIDIREDSAGSPGSSLGVSD